MIVMATDRMQRPRRGNRYTRRVELRLTPQQRQKLQKIADSKGLNLSQTIRVVVLGEKPPGLTGITRELFYELSRMGNNLNQIAKVLNCAPLYQIPLPASEIIALKGDLQLAMNFIKVLQVKLEQ